MLCIVYALRSIVPNIVFLYTSVDLILLCITVDYEGGIAFDKGCESPVPFGAVTIDMVIRAAKQLGEL